MMPSCKLTRECINIVLCTCTDQTVYNIMHSSMKVLSVLLNNTSALYVRMWTCVHKGIRQVRITKVKFDTLYKYIHTTHVQHTSFI